MERFGMKKRIFGVLLFLFESSLAGAPYASDATKSGILLDVPWKITVHTFSQDKLKHPAWGTDHSERIFQLAVDIARSEGFELDTDVLFAAAFLHDMGAFEPYRKEGVDHAERSVQVIEEVLGPSGFPMAKLDAVRDAIRGHSYYEKPSQNPEAIALHDADTLDFLGAIGVLRIVSITGQGSWASDLSKALDTLKGFQKDLPEKLVTKTAQKMGKIRVREMGHIFRMIDAESYGNKVETSEK